MKKYLAVLLGSLFIFGCDMFISRGGEGQPCFSDSQTCSGDLICHEGRCVREIPDAGEDGGDDEGDPTGDDARPDAGDDGGQAGDDAGETGDDPGADRAADGGGEDGGDESTTEPVQIYRSVGPYSGESMNGEQNGVPILFTSSHANFTYDIDDAVGVGDVIQYDTDTDHIPDALVFIHERISAREFVVAKADGTPMDEVINSTTWGILRAYTSLADAVNLTENTYINDAIEDFDDINAQPNPRNLKANNVIWNIACYESSYTDDTKVLIDHWITSENCYLRIFTPDGPGSEAGATQRHAGCWTNDRYQLNVVLTMDNQAAIQIGDAYVHIDGLQIGKNGDAVGRMAAGIEALGLTVLHLSNSIIRGTQSNGYGVFLESTGELRMWNTIIHNVAESSGDAVHLKADTVAFIYNSTIYQSHRGIYVDGSTTSQALVKNVIAVANSSYDFDNNSSFLGDSSNNCSSDTSAPGADSHTEVSPDDLFIQSSTDPPDLHLKDNSAGDDNGVNLANDEHIPISDDIDGDVRPSVATSWDIGADENGQ